MPVFRGLCCKKIQSHIMRFLWRGRPPKVAAKVLCQNISNGGLGAVSVYEMYKSLKLGWIKKMLSDVPWAGLLQARCAPYKINDLLKSRFTESDISRFQLSKFYIETLTIFSQTVSAGLPTSPIEIRKEVLWLNKCVIRGNRTIFDKNMYACGITFIGDICDDSGSLMNFAEVKRKYPGLNTNFLCYLGIISAIPQSWKNKLRNARGKISDEYKRSVWPMIIMEDKQVSLAKIRTKDYYWLSFEKVKPTAVMKWEIEGIEPGPWADLFNIPYVCTKSTKLQAFQYQVIHRYIPTRKFLFVRRIADNPHCTQCNDIDTITHYFVSCPRVAVFWDTVFEFVNRYLSEHLEPNANNILFGSLSVPPVINLLIILAKHFIHTRKMENAPLAWQPYLAYVSDTFQIERRAAAGCQKLRAAVREKWKKIEFENSIT